MAKYRNYKPKSVTYAKVDKLAEVHKAAEAAAKRAAKTVRQKGRQKFITNMADKRLAAKAINAQKQMARTQEFYKTQRSKSRATKLSAAAAAMYESGEKTERMREQEQTARLNTQLQYSKLINGNQNSKDAATEDYSRSNDSDNAKGWVNWN